MAYPQPPIPPLWKRALFYTSAFVVVPLACVASFVDLIATGVLLAISALGIIFSQSAWRCPACGHRIMTILKPHYHCRQCGMYYIRVVPRKRHAVDVNPSGGATELPADSN